MNFGVWLLGLVLLFISVVFPPALIPLGLLVFYCAATGGCRDKPKPDPKIRMPYQAGGADHVEPINPPPHPYYDIRNY